jgi:hypothetical protein
LSELKGSIGFLDVGDQTADVSWLCVVTHPKQVTPELKIERLVKGKLDGKVKLTLTENGAGGARAVGPKGEVQLSPQLAPTANGTLFVWSLTLLARAGGPDVTYVLSGREDAQSSFEALAQVGATSLQRPQLNTGSPVNLLLKEAPVPRFSVGINQAVPRDPPASYKGFSPGNAPPALADSGGAGPLRALLFRLFVILDTPGTLDPLWDQQSLTTTLDSLSDARFQKEKVRVAEELWARQVTEMLAFTPYGGPSVGYGGGCTDLELVATGIGAGASNPRYGIFYACQHLANFGVLSRGLHKLSTSKTFASGILLEANAGCVDAVMNMGGAWLDATTPPKVRTAAPGGDPGALADGTGRADLTPTITGSFPANGTTFKYQPGSVHLFSNRPARADNRAGYVDAIDKKNAGIKPANGTFCTIVTVAKGSAVTKVPKPTPGGDPNVQVIPGAITGPRELCVVVTDTKFEHQAADLMVSKAQPGKLFAGHNVAAPVPPHLGFALRTRKARVQLFDTGGFSISAKAGGVNRAAGVTAVPPSQQFHGGNYDDPLGDEIHGAHPFRGTGVFPPVDEAAAQTMRDHVFNVLRKARPLGLAKLVVFKRDPAQEAKGLMPLIVYSSPLLNTYDGSSDESNYAISRYMWSLRNLPGAANVGAVWLIWAPQRDLAAAMRDAPRTTTAVTLASNLSGLPPGRDRRLHDFLLSRLNPAVQIASQPDGTVRVFTSNKGPPHPALSLVQRGDVLLDRPMMPKDPTSLTTLAAPKYFDA